MVIATTATVRADAEGARLRPAIAQALARGLQDIRGEAVQRLTANNSIATGQLRRSLATGVDQRPDELIGWIGMEEYGEAVEFGTGPHIPPIVTPEGGGLLRWVIAKGLVRGSEKYRDKRPRGRLTEAMRLKPEEIERRLTSEGVSKRSRRTAELAAGLRQGGYNLDRSGLNDMESEELKVAYGVQYAISIKGTKARPFLRPALAEQMSRLLERLDAALGGAEWA